MADAVETQDLNRARQSRHRTRHTRSRARLVRRRKRRAAGRSRLREQVDQRSTQAGERISSTSSDLRSVGQELRKQGKDTPARLADPAADRVERVGSYLGQSDADRILRDVEDFGRRQPLAVLAGGMVLGIAAARFLKASSSRRYGSRTATFNGANHPEHAQRTISAWEGSAPPAAAPDVRGATPDPGEHHQRFEGHN